MTEYFVFREIGEGSGDDWWCPANTSRVKARSAHAAIRAAHEGEAIPGGRFVAVPARSFKPVTVKVETKTELRFS